jgi:4-alpha-glucanotransferase
MQDLQSQILATPSAALWKRIGIHPHHGIVVFLPALRSAKSCGIGEFLDLLPIIDWCQEIKLDVIQLLPLNNSDSDPSPYNPLSATALNFLFLSLHALPFLEEKAELRERLQEFAPFNKTQRVDYTAVQKEKERWLRAYFEAVREKLVNEDAFKAFTTHNPWVKSFALFSTLKTLHGNAPVDTWPALERSPTQEHMDILLRTHASAILFYTAMQFLCFEQLKSVKDYAQNKGIFLKGDIPILVGKESADVWLHPQYFDTHLAAGAPPDYFFSQGQYWGFPIYRWDALREDHFLWWKQRLKYASHFFDLFRIDHVIGFFRIWAVPPHTAAKKGHYVPETEEQWETQGRELLHMLIENAAGMMPIAEDLGTVPDVLPVCLREMGICGTKVMRWEREWKKKEEFIPISHYPPMSLTCVSTHDSETLSQWWMTRRSEVKKYVHFKKWDMPHIPLVLPSDKRLEILWDAHHTSSLFHINLLQEYFALFPELVWPKPEDERINLPGPMSPVNWTYRYRTCVEEFTSHAGLLGAMKKILLLLLLAIAPLYSSATRALYHTLDPLSVSQHLAFYELYSDTEEGKEALRRAWQLLSGQSLTEMEVATSLPKLDIQALASLITRPYFEAPIALTADQLTLIEKISATLRNRALKGHSAWNRAEILALPPEEIDLARGLLLFQFEENTPKDAIRNYEAVIDILSLQIAARLPKEASHSDKIEAINHFIFHEMGFRFPPHSLYAKDIDLYTFLPSVLDSRQGVCLGVSILYLCIAQRLDLPLEIITPPGHIYVRYHSHNTLINIETTARGIDLPSETYLGVNTRLLPQRTIKDVIGLTFVNQASVYWAKEQYTPLPALYEKARLFLPDDPLLKMLLGYSYLFVGRKKEGGSLLKEIKGIPFQEAVSAENIPEDYLKGKVDIAGIKTVFLPVDETRASVLKKQQALTTLLKKFPAFRDGIFHLAITYLQLGRGKEANELLERFHKLDPTNSTVEYYLSILSLERLDYNRAWLHLKKTEQLVHNRLHYPKALTTLRGELRRRCPEPL